MRTILPFVLPVLLMVIQPDAAVAQDLSDYPRLPRDRYRSGQTVLNAFAPISAAARGSIVELNVKEDTAALGAVVDADGLVLTKASEIKTGKLTCWLASGKEVDAQLLAVDDDDDVALVRVKADGLKPIQWEQTKVVEGQWAITPGLADTPQAVGIVSTLPHRIRPERALMGVKFDLNDARPTVSALSHGFGAEKAGVLPGDVIVSIEGASVTNSEQVVEILRDYRSGQKVHIHFQRAKQEFDADIQMTTPKPGQEGSELGGNARENQMSGDVSVRNQGFDEAIEHDTVLEPWQCGGPLLDLDGKTIGLNIARASRFATYALPASLAQEILIKLKAKAEAAGRNALVPVKSAKP